jgi:hypothetical protein
VLQACGCNPSSTTPRIANASSNRGLRGIEAVNLAVAIWACAVWVSRGLDPRTAGAGDLWRAATSDRGASAARRAHRVGFRSTPPPAIILFSAELSRCDRGLRRHDRHGTRCGHSLSPPSTRCVGAAVPGAGGITCRSPWATSCRVGAGHVCDNRCAASRAASSATVGVAGRTTYTLTLRRAGHPAEKACRTSANQSLSAICGDPPRLARPRRSGRGGPTIAGKAHHLAGLLGIDRRQCSRRHSPQLRLRADRMGGARVNGLWRATGPHRIPSGLLIALPRRRASRGV